MRIRALIALLLLLLIPAVETSAQAKKAEKKGKEEEKSVRFGEPLPNGVKFGTQLTQRWKVGVSITAPPAAPCGGVFATVPIPTDWPEQQVRMLSEDIPPQVRSVEYRTLDKGVKQMLITIPSVNAGETVQATVTCEVTRLVVLPPEDPTQLVMPQKNLRQLQSFLSPSPMIESTHAKIKALAKEVVKDKQSDSPWQQVEAIYDYVRDHVEYRDGPLKGALGALKDGTGDCEELTSLFIALCRANRIPARTVWVPGHCYPEFYLEDQDGAGHWIPCQAAGTRDFGGIPDTRPILQKGDNYRVPEKKEPQRYVAEFLSVQAIKGTGKPTFRSIREVLPAN